MYGVLISMKKMLLYKLKQNIFVCKRADINFYFMNFYVAKSRSLLGKSLVFLEQKVDIFL